MTAPAARRRIVVVTGMAGAGLSTARTAFEDIGFEAIDNLPLSLAEQLINSPDASRPLAFGIDVRTRGFAADKVLELIDNLNQRPDTEARLVFLECENEQLIARFSETRRRHPLAQERPIADGLAMERQLLQPLKARANLMIDTSLISTTDLRHLLHGHFPPEGGRGLGVQVMSFSYRYGVPREADLVFDARFLANPHYIKELQPQTGQDQPVGEYIRQDPAFAPFFQGLSQCLTTMLPGFKRNDRPYLTIAFGCTGGKHRSVFLTECLARWFEEQGYPVRVSHRELTRNGTIKPRMKPAPASSSATPS